MPYLGYIQVLEYRVGIESDAARVVHRCANMESQVGGPVGLSLERFSSWDFDRQRSSGHVDSNIPRRQRYGIQEVQ